MDEKTIIKSSFVQLARLALSGRRADVVALLRRVASRVAASEPAFSQEIRTLVVANRASVTRKATPVAIPTDSDSRLQLVRHEFPVFVDHEPVWSESVARTLNTIVLERQKEEDLLAAGLSPSRSMLLTGPPGVGKTLAARWLAEHLGAPLFVLDLAAVMSSYLGRTGNNLRAVLDFAKDRGCVLLLDEFDAIAKRRDDLSEIGELKRLVTVLLQAVDDWPSSGLLLAATNHPGLLDPAVWRRFERIVEFPMPERIQVCTYLARHLPEVDDNWLSALSVVLLGRSFGSIEHFVNQVKRASVLTGQPLERTISEVIDQECSALTRADRLKVADGLLSIGLSQRQVSRMTGVSRDTLRRRRQEGGRQ